MTDLQTIVTSVIVQALLNETLQGNLKVFVDPIIKDGAYTGQIRLTQTGEDGKTENLLVSVMTEADLTTLTIAYPAKLEEVPPE